MALRRFCSGYAELGDRWAALAEATAGAAAPFRGPWFGGAWWSVFGERHGGELELVGLDDGGGLAAVLPLLRTGASATFAGDHEVSDYLGPVAAPGRERAAASALFDHLEEQRIAAADLRGLRESDGWARLIASTAAERGWEAEVLDEAACPVIDIGAGWDAYLGGLRPRDRRETRRKLRVLRGLRGAASFEALEEPGAIQAEMPAFLRMMAESRGDKAEFLSAEMECFFRRLAEAMSARGLLRLYVLRISGEAAAMVMCFPARGDDGEELLMYNSGFDPKFREMSAGLASKVLCIRDAAERGAARVNFLRGDEPYKFELGGKAEIVQRVALRRRAP